MVIISDPFAHVLLDKGCFNEAKLQFSFFHPLVARQRSGVSQMLNQVFHWVRNQQNGTNGFIMDVLLLLETKGVEVCLIQWMVSRCYSWFLEGFKDVVTLHIQNLAFYHTDPVRTIIVDVGNLLFEDLQGIRPQIGKTDHRSPFCLVHSPSVFLAVQSQLLAGRQSSMAVGTLASSSVWLCTYVRCQSALGWPCV